MISVRLHGSLQSILAGVPSIHLSYERKGWGAYQDLGIEQYVHNAYDFDPELVAIQARQLAASSESYWSAIERNVPNIRYKRQSLIDGMRALVED